MESNSPLDNISTSLRESLTKAGWQPGTSLRAKAAEVRRLSARKIVNRFFGKKSRDPYDDPYYVNRTFHIFPAAETILDELWGLKISPLQRRGQTLPVTVWFNLSLVCGFENEINTLSRLLKTNLVPIGQLLSTEILLISPDQLLFSLSFVSRGVFFEGQGFGVAVERILRGDASRPILFSPELDPDGCFDIEYISESWKHPIHINDNVGLKLSDFKIIE